MDLQQELSNAVKAVRLASHVCIEVQNNLINAATIEKKDHSPVTVADYASQALVCATLAQLSSVKELVGEEDSAELRKDDSLHEDKNRENRAKVVAHIAKVWGSAVSEKQALDWIDLGNFEPNNELKTYWTLDPIDGTKGFLRAGQYAIALALIDNGQVVTGVLGCPNLVAPDGSLGVILTAIKGQGAFIYPLNNATAKGEKISVNELANIADARFCESVESGHSDQDQSAQIAHALGITSDAVRMDSQAKYATVARGHAEIYLRLPTRKDYREKIWDHAAGMLIVEEAGGMVTDVTGQPLDFSQGKQLENNRGVIATSKKFHSEVLEAVSKFIAL